jgi:hypothetical protein
MKKQRRSIIFVVLLLIVPITAWSDNNAWTTAFRMDSMGISASTLPHVGDTVQLAIQFTSNVTGLATLQLHFPDWWGASSHYQNTYWNQHGTWGTINMTVKIQ